MKSIGTYITCIFTSFLLLQMMTGCKPSAVKSKRIKEVDSLINEIQFAGKKLDFDINIIKNRADTIGMQLSYVQHNYTDTVDRDMQFLLTEYSALKSGYEFSIGEYQKLKKENEEHLERIKNLKHDLMTDSITGEQFDQYFEKERKIIGNHAKEVNKLVKNLIDVQRMYDRTNEKMTKIYLKLKKQKEQPKS